MAKTIALVNEIKPDALVVLGSLTWSGSNDDFEAFGAYLDQFKVPAFVVPGHRDKLMGSLDSYRQLVGNRDSANAVQTVSGVALAFSSDLHGEPTRYGHRRVEPLESGNGLHRRRSGEQQLAGKMGDIQSRLRQTETATSRCAWQSRRAVQLQLRRAGCGSVL